MSGLQGKWTRKKNWIEQVIINHVFQEENKSRVSDGKLRLRDVENSYGKNKSRPIFYSRML